MMIKYPLYIDTFTVATDIPDKDETEFLTEVFMIFNHQHVIEAYKEVQQRNPDLYPPLLEEQ
mgnify:CR=1 FL=1